MKTTILACIFCFLINMANAQTGNKLTVSYQTSPKANTTGIVYGRVDTPPINQWGYGFDMRLEFIDFSDKFTSEIFMEHPDFDRYEYVDFSTGVDFIQRMGGKAYVIFPVHIHIGSEKLENTWTEESIERMFVGTSAGLMIMFMPNQFGITLGFGITGKISTAEIYKADLGPKLEIGFKF